MMKLIPKNWAEFQHYKDRCPPWIKLHRDLLNDREFMGLPLASKALAPLLWLLASEEKDGCFQADSEELVFRLRIASKDIDAGLKPLIDKGFFLIASGVLAERLHDAIPETERETEREAEKKLVSLKSKAVFKIEKPDGVSENLWSDFLAVRKAKNLPLTETALEGIKREAGKANLSMAEVITVCCERGWGGFSAAWLKDEVSVKQVAGAPDWVAQAMAAKKRKEAQA